MRRVLITLALVAPAVSGCAAPDLGARPDLVAPAGLASTATLAGTSQAWPQSQWWHAYGDAQLDAMVEEALAGSPDVAAAAARIRIARGVMQSSGAALLPQVNASGGASAVKQSYNNGIPQAFVPKGWNDTGDLALSASFDLDLWGRNRALLAAATSEARAAEVDAAQSRLMLTSSIVSGYAALARLYAEQDVLEQAVKAREATATLTGQRVARGLDNEAPLRQANAALAAARLELEANAEQIALQRHALAALMGAGPDRGLSIQRPDVRLLTPTPLPADAGIALIGRRPDIVAARMRAEAQGRRIDAARAAFMPDISLSGLIGLQSLGFGHLLDAGSDYGSAKAAISLPIFNGGQLRGNYRQARGQYDLAVANYDSTVIQALREVADAIASRDSAERQIAAADRALNEAQGGYDLAMQRYKGGLASYLDVLTAEDALISAERTATDARYRRVALDAALVRALGGGFTEQDVKDQQS